FSPRKIDTPPAPVLEPSRTKSKGPANRDWRTTVSLQLTRRAMRDGTARSRLYLKYGQTGIHSTKAQIATSPPSGPPRRSGADVPVAPSPPCPVCGTDPTKSWPCSCTDSDRKQVVSTVVQPPPSLPQEVGPATG